MTLMNGNRVLIIEDEDTLADICAEQLKNHGYTVVSTGTGSDGIKQFRQDDKFGVVVTDVKLPDMSGLDILREIKKLRPNTEVIIITAFPDYDIASNALKLGADDYMEKPFRMDVFQRTVEKALERFHLRRENQVYQQRLSELIAEKNQEVAASHQKLESEHHTLRSLINEISAGIFFTDNNNKVLEINGFALDTLGKSYTEVIGSSLSDDTKLKKIVKHAQPIIKSRNLLESSQPPEDVCINRRWLSVNVTSLESGKDENGKMLYTFYDVTERRNLENRVKKHAQGLEHRVEQSGFELKKAMEFSRVMLDAAHVFAFFAAKDRSINMWNQFAEVTTGISAEEAASLDIFYRLLPNSPPGTRIPFETDSLKPTESGTTFQTSIRSTKNEIRQISWTATPIPDAKNPDGTLFIGVDITDQKILEDKLQQYNSQLEEMVETRTVELRSKDAQLVHSSRLAALGEIAAGIAHEMKQPLNGISITADLLKLLQQKHELTDDSLNTNLDMIKTMVERMSHTINHLRGFAYQGSDQFNPISLQDAADGVFSILGEQLRIHGVDIRMDIPEDLPLILGEINQIEQVLINLLTNARDAMDRREKDAQQQKTSLGDWSKILKISISVKDDESALIIEVSDTGHGIDPDVIKQIYDPFFTTKDVGEGTGLGLSISQNIIEQHHGTISVESKLGVGTTFRIELPIPDSVFSA